MNIILEENINKIELIEFLSKVDNYFIGTLSVNCKCNSLSEWADKLISKAKFITARNNKNEIVGCGVFYPNSESEYIYLNVIAVLKDYSNQNIGTNIFYKLMQYSKDNKRCGIILECHIDNKRAFNLYKRIGFKVDKSKNIDSKFILMVWE